MDFIADSPPATRTRIPCGVTFGPGDSLTVPLWGGVGAERTVNLGPTYSLARYHPGGTDRSTHPADETISRYRQGAIAQLLRSRRASPDWQSVVQDLAAAIETIQPSLIASPHPMLAAPSGSSVHDDRTTRSTGPGERPARDVTPLYQPSSPVRVLAVWALRSDDPCATVVRSPVSCRWSSFFSTHARRADEKTVRPRGNA